MGGIFGPIAGEAAYRYGADWLDQLLVYYREILIHYRSILKRIYRKLSYLNEPTYLAWLDCKVSVWADRKLRDFMINKARLGLNNGTSFGPGPKVIKD